MSQAFVLFLDDVSAADDHLNTHTTLDLAQVGRLERHERVTSGNAMGIANNNTHGVSGNAAGVVGGPPKQCAAHWCDQVLWNPPLFAWRSVRHLTWLLTTDGMHPSDAHRDVAPTSLSPSSRVELAALTTHFRASNDCALRRRRRGGRKRRRRRRRRAR